MNKYGRELEELSKLYLVQHKEQVKTEHFKTEIIEARKVALAALDKAYEENEVQIPIDIYAIASFFGVRFGMGNGSSSFTVDSKGPIFWIEDLNTDQITPHNAERISYLLAVYLFNFAPDGFDDKLADELSLLSKSEVLRCELFVISILAPDLNLSLNYSPDEIIQLSSNYGIPLPLLRKILSSNILTD